MRYLVLAIVLTTGPAAAGPVEDWLLKKVTEPSIYGPGTNYQDLAAEGDASLARMEQEALDRRIRNLEIDQQMFKKRLIQNGQ